MLKFETSDGSLIGWFDLSPKKRPKLEMIFKTFIYEQTGTVRDTFYLVVHCNKKANNFTHIIFGNERTANQRELLEARVSSILYSQNGTIQVIKHI